MLTTIIKNNPTNYANSSAKLATICAATLTAHYCLEYTSTCAHEHGHGMTSGGNYTITMIPKKEILEPWNGEVSLTTNKNSFLTTLGGPVAGLTTTYAQCIAFTMLDECLNNKPLNASFYKGLYFPISFFTEKVKTGNNYFSALLNTQSTSLLNQPTIISTTIHFILFLRMGRIIAEFIYGLLPYTYGSINGKAVNGDGKALWKMLLGPKMPTFGGNLTNMTLVIITAPYIIGAAQAIYENTQ